MTYVRRGAIVQFPRVGRAQVRDRRLRIEPDGVGFRRAGYGCPSAPPGTPVFVE